MRSELEMSSGRRSLSTTLGAVDEQNGQRPTRSSFSKRAEEGLRHFEGHESLPECLDAQAGIFRGPW